MQNGKNEQEKEDVEEKAGEEYRRERMSRRNRIQRGKNEQEKEDVNERRYKKEEQVQE